MGMLNLGLQQGLWGGGVGGGAGTANHFDRRPFSLRTAPIDYWVSTSSEAAVTEKHALFDNSVKLCSNLQALM